MENYRKSLIRNNRVKKISSELDAVIKRATSDSRATGSRDGEATRPFSIVSCAALSPSRFERGLGSSRRRDRVGRQDRIRIVRDRLPVPLARNRGRQGPQRVRSHAVATARVQKRSCRLEVTRLASDAVWSVLLFSVSSIVRKCAVPRGHLRGETSFSRTRNIPNVISCIYCTALVMLETLH